MSDRRLGPARIPPDAPPDSTSDLHALAELLRAMLGTSHRSREVLARIDRTMSGTDAPAEPSGFAQLLEDLSERLALPG